MTKVNDYIIIFYVESAFKNVYFFDFNNFEEVCLLNKNRIRRNYSSDIVNVYLSLN